MIIFELSNKKFLTFIFREVFGKFYQAKSFEKGSFINVIKEMMRVVISFHDLVSQYVDMKYQYLFESDSQGWDFEQNQNLQGKTCKYRSLVAQSVERQAVNL